MAMASRDGLPSSDIFPTASSGVFSMLKTTTDTGDIGPMSFNKQRLPSSVPRPTRRQRTNPSHLSDDSYGSFATSGRSRSSIRSGRAFDGGQPPAGPRSSTTSLQTTRTAPSSYMPDIGSLPPLPGGLRNLPSGPSPAPSSLDSRAYSLSHTRYPTPLSMQRSVSSLRSQATAPRLPSQSQHAYPGRAMTRSRDYRPVSPALSDYAGGFQYTSAMPEVPPPARTRIPGPRPPLISYYSDYAPPIPLQMPSRRHLIGGPPLYHQSYQSHPSHTPQNMYLPDQSFRVYPSDPRAQQNIHGFVHAPAYPPVGRPRPMAPPVLLNRDYTPRTQSTPASSHQGSSANSSNPTTPGDVVTGDQGVIDPAFIDPALTDLQDDGTDSLYRHYPRFMKQSSDPLHDYTQPMTAHELEGSPIIAPDGFVNRMKSLLGAYEASPTTCSNHTEKQQTPLQLLDKSDACYNDSPAVVELPGDLAADDVSQTNVLLGVPAVRITREMVKAVTSPSSSERDTTTVDLKNRLESDLQHDETGDEGNSNMAIHERSSDECNTTSTATQPCPEHANEGSQTSTVTLTTFSHMAGMDQPDHDPHDQEESTVNAALIPRRSDSPPKMELSLRMEAAPSELAAAQVVATISTSTLVPPKISSKVDGPPDKPTAGQIHHEPNKSTCVTSASTVRSDSVSTSALTSSDWAIRISLPPASSNTARVGGWHVPTASEVLPAEFFDGPRTTVSPRQSLHSIDAIPPLRITKSVEPDGPQATGEAADLSGFIRRSFPRRQSCMFSDVNGAKKTTTDDLVDGRPSGAGSKSTIDHMPGLREESQEDMVAPYNAVSAKFKFPSMHSNALMGAESIDLRERDPMPALSSSQRPGMSLRDIRDLPSLHFSQMDLVDRLNDALHKRTSTRPSNFVRRRKNFSGIVCPSPMRPTSTESLRERYTSFFNKPLEFKVPMPLDESESFGADRAGTDNAGENDIKKLSDVRLVEPDVEQQPEDQPVELDSQEIKLEDHKTDVKLTKVHSSPLSRPLSPEEFLGIATDAARLSVPSVAVLSERLSELLPSIKHLNLDSVVNSDEAVKQTLDEIHHIGNRPITTLSGRSSSGLRLMAAAAEDIATNGTHESIRFSSRANFDKDLPPLPQDSDKPIVNLPIRSTTTDLTFPTEPPPAVLRAASDSKLSNDKSSAIRESILPVELHHSSVLDSTLDSRPWNSDENYPWSGDGITVEIPLARPATAKCSDKVVSDIVRHTGGISPSGNGQVRRRSVSSFDSSVSQLEPTNTVTADTLTQTNQALRSATKTSVARGSLMSRVRAMSPIAGVDSQDGNKSIVDISMSTTIPHKPGDRYPCSALISPLGFDLEHDTPSIISEPSSKISDGDDAPHSGDARLNRKQSGLLSLKRRISELPISKKARIGPMILVQRPDSEVGRPISDMSNPYSPAISRVASPERVSRFTVASPNVDSPDGLFITGLDGREPQLGSTLEMTSNTMGKVEFGVKSIGERLRMLFAKGSELIRTLSGKGRKERQMRRQQERELWLDDSIYS